MNIAQLKHYRLMAPEPGEGGGGADASDRGDNFEGTEDGTIEGGAGKDAKVDDKGKDTVDGAGGDDTLKGGDGDDKDKEKGGKKEQPAVPLSRHKEILNKERAAREKAETELAKFKTGDRVAAMNEDIKKAEGDIEKLDGEYAQLITDGKHAEAAAKMKEIRALERELGNQKADFASQVAETRAVERARYDNTVEKLESAYPVLNPDDDEYDEGKTQDVLDLAAVYNGRGMTPSKALQEAAKKLLGAATKKQESAVDTETQVSEADKAKAVAEERRKAQLAKNLDTKGKQPPIKEKVGANHDAAGGGIDGKSVMQMKYDDFVKLDDETLSRMRGDMVA